MPIYTPGGGGSIPPSPTISGKITVNQLVDGEGIQINGFDDQSGNNVLFGIDDNGFTRIQTTSILDIDSFGSTLKFQSSAGANVSFFASAGAGENRVISLSGYKTGVGKRYMQFNVGRYR